MKKFFAIVAALIIFASATTTFAEEPTCILLKFSNDTRYKNIDSAAVLSDLVIEKLLASGKFNFNETRPIDEDIEAKLYDVKTRELLNLTTGLQNKNLNPLFEGQGFDKTQAQSIGTADVGQIISPSITSAIGNAHGAQYLIQGTVINMGNGTWGDIDNPSKEISAKTSGIAIQTDLRVIKASTGEVVWRKIVTGEKKTTLVDLGKVISFAGFSPKIGSSKLTSDIYNQALNDAATKISAAMIEDLNAGRLFAK